ncbi:MAG: TrkH family potassium uptake protein [Planctomycetota bacterium]
MNLTVVLHLVGRLALFHALLLLAPLAVSLGYQHLHPGHHEPYAFLVAIAASAAVGVLLMWRFRLQLDRLGYREGFAIVTLAWTTIAILGSLPYMLVGGTTASGQPLALGPIDAFFEAMSGFTTTGASVFTDIEAWGHGIQFWRCMTQWLGGMGIIMLAIAILPSLGAGAYQLMQAEVPGPTADKIAPRVTQTAGILWGVYLLLTVLQILLLWLPEAWHADGVWLASDVAYRSDRPHMDLFEATCHAFTTLSTGGFSPRAGSMAEFSPWHQWVVITFMFLAGMNFLLHWHLLMGRPRELWRNHEFRHYALWMLGLTLLVVLAVTFIRGHGAGAPVPVSETEPTTVESTIRHSLFQVLSLGTCCGYATADYDRWPDVARILLVIAMIAGGCVGSTSGGIKQMRLLLLVKAAFAEVRRLPYPHQVVLVRSGGQRVSDRVLVQLLSTVSLYLLMLLVASLLLMCIPGFDFESAFSCAATTAGNVGPGVGSVGPAQNFAWIPDAGKLLCCALMLLGRLEIYTVIVLLLPAMYRR